MFISYCPHRQCRPPSSPREIHQAYSSIKTGNIAVNSFFNDAVNISTKLRQNLVRLLSDEFKIIWKEEVVT
jgi:hypothetical protein